MDGFAMFGKYAIYILWALSNVLFIMYDYALGGIVEMYISKMKPKIFGKAKKEKQNNNK